MRKNCCGLALSVLFQHGSFGLVEIERYLSIKSGLIMRLRGPSSAVRIIHIYGENVFCCTCKASKKFEAFILFDWNYESGLVIICLVSDQLFSGQSDEEELQS